jgi:hypothetical protein
VGEEMQAMMPGSGGGAAVYIILIDRLRLSSPQLPVKIEPHLADHGHAIGDPLCISARRRATSTLILKTQTTNNHHLEGCLIVYTTQKVVFTTLGIYHGIYKRGRWYISWYIP